MAMHQERIFLCVLCVLCGQKFVLNHKGHIRAWRSRRVGHEGNGKLDVLDHLPNYGQYLHYVLHVGLRQLQQGLPAYQILMG